MKKLLFLSFIFIGSVHAGLHDNYTDLAEITEALAHCPGNVANILTDENEYVSNVTGKYFKINNLQSTKTYLFETRIKNGFNEDSNLMTKLTIRVFIDQPDSRKMGAKQSVRYRCSTK